MMVLGGKIGNKPIESKFTNSVICYNMKECFAAELST